jgi:hypothetical protein
VSDRRAIPAQHPRPLSEAERNRQEAIIISANNGANDTDTENLDESIEEEVSTSLSERYQKWQDVSEVLLKTYVESHELHGHADPCLEKPITAGTKPQSCDCASRSTSWPIQGFMMFSKYKDESEKQKAPKT